MTFSVRAFLALPLGGALCLLTLTGCLRHENDPGQGGLTIGENKELDAAAAELDARPRAPAPPVGATSPTSAPPAASTPPQGQSQGQPQSQAGAQPQAAPAQRPSLGGIGRASQPKAADKPQ